MPLPAPARLLRFALCPLFATAALGLAAQTADLSLALSQTADPAGRYSFYEVTAVVVNDGPDAATGLAVSLPLPEGTVFKGGDEYRTTDGRFSPNGSRRWTIERLAAGARAELTLNLFLLAEEVPDYYGQVVASDAADPDSSPGNGMTGQVVEDDEASVLLASGADLALSLERTFRPRNFTDYQTVVTLVNNGPKAATGVVVEVPFAQGEGAVFRGSGAFTATQGSYSPYGKQRWTVGELAAGDTAVLALNLYRLDGDLPEQYAQVAASEVADPDSEPGNGTPGVVREDDEATSVLTPEASPNLALDTITFDVDPSQVGAGEVSFNVLIENDTDLPVPTPFRTAVYVSADATLDDGDTLVYRRPYSDLPAGRRIRLSDDFRGDDFAPGDYFLIAVVDVDEEVPERDEGDNVFAVPFTLGGGGTAGFADLSLAVERDRDPGAFESFGARVLVFNDGPAVASRVVVSVPFAQGEGAVLRGDDPFVRSQGSYSPYGGQEWFVGTLRPGDTAVLALNLYRLDGELADLYAQVAESTQDDPDSTPGNGVPGEVREDDEASTQAGGVGGGGGEEDCAFPVPFAGLPVPADLLEGFVSVEGEPGGGFVVTQTAFAPNDDPFEYGDLAAEAVFRYSAEGELLESPKEFSGIQPATAPLDLTAEADVERDVLVLTAAADSSFRQEFPMTLARGDFRFERIDAYPLGGTEYLVLAKVLTPGTFEPNASSYGFRVDIAGSGTLLAQGSFGDYSSWYQVYEPRRVQVAPDGGIAVVLFSTADFELDLLRLTPQLRQVYQVALPVRRGDVADLLLREDGSSVIALRSADDNAVALVSGKGEVRELPFGTTFPGQSRLRALDTASDGGFAFARVYFAGSLLGTVVQVYDAEDRLRYEGVFTPDNLTDLGAKPRAELIIQDVLAGGTLYASAAAADGGTLIFRFDPDGSLSCASGDGASDGECPANETGFVDLELTATASDLTPDPLAVTSVTYELTNRGTREVIPSIEVFIDLPEGVVFSGNNPYDETSGAYSLPPFGDGLWTLAGLSPGESQSITVNYFVREPGGFLTYAEVRGFRIGNFRDERGVVEQLPCEDPDSNPGNGDGVSAREDDEVALDLRYGEASARSGVTLAAGVSDRRAEASVILRDIPADQPAQLVVTDLAGRVAIRSDVQLHAGENRLSFPIAGLAPGVYVVAAPATEAAPVKLVVR